MAVRADVFEYIERFHNPRRSRWTLDFREEVGGTHSTGGPKWRGG